MASPSHVEINGVKYRLYRRAQNQPLSPRYVPYREWVESDVLRQAVEIGSSRPAEQPRPEVRTWRIDDWSAGGGYKFLDSTQDHPSQRGYQQSRGDPVDVSVPGQMSCGLQPISNSATSTGASGPYLAVTDGKLFSAAGGYTRGVRYQNPVDTWADIGGALDAADAYGPLGTHHAGVFVGSNADLWRVTTAGAVNWNTEDARSPLVADNRVYYFVRGTITSTLKSAGLDAVAAGTVKTTFNGVGSSFAGSPLQSVAIGSRIYSLLGNAGEDPRLWILENGVGREVAVLAGLRLNSTDPAVGTQFMAVVNGIIYIGGYEVGIDGNQLPRMDYFDGQTWGTVFRIDYTSGELGPITAVASGRKNEVIFSVLEVISGSTHWRYDTTTGGVSKFARGYFSTAATSLAYLDGIYYKAGLNYIERTKTSGSGKYTSGTVYMPVWDFDLPDTEKLFTEIEIQTESIPAGASVAIWFALDNGTVLTTDASGTALQITSGTRQVFTISNAANERTFRYIQPFITLTPDGTGTNTPVLYSVTLRCIPLGNKTRKFEMLVDCSDETATDRKTGQQLSGNKILSNLQALRDSTTNRVFTFTPLYKDSLAPSPGPTETQHVVMLEPGGENGIFEATGQGEGVMRLRLQKVG